MEIYVLITLGIISSWLICNSFILYLGILYQNQVALIIFNGKQLLKYWLFILAMVGLSFYLLFIRTQNMGKVVNINTLWANILEIIESIPWSILTILAMVVLLAILFIFLVIQLVYKNIQIRLLALYLYYYQYTFFKRKLVGRQIELIGYFHCYLVHRVMIFTQKESYVILALIIWPQSLYWLEPRICKILLPYLVIFDFITQDGYVSKVFYVIPWYYIYMLLRTTWFTFHNFFIEKNTEFSDAVYKKFIINGKLHRMAIIPNTKDN